MFTVKRLDISFKTDRISQKAQYSARGMFLRKRMVVVLVCLAPCTYKYLICQK
uniref:Uncharacterized protein n=1 Tax=Anguilla anguilla TaxID=7936 RepID=A0A0E9T521_ANGAN